MSSSRPQATAANLFLSCPDNSTRLILSIPISETKNYASKPLKWLRYLGFAIAGQRGCLSTSSAGPEIDNYDAELEAKSYYFILDGVWKYCEPCLIDVDVLKGRTSGASGTQSSLSMSSNQRASDFRQRVINRDGTCVISNEPASYCQAAHIIPHAKGNLYLQRLSSHHKGAYDTVEGLDDIDDIRNGLLLGVYFYPVFGRGEAAFLKTPNYGLTAEDIPSRPGAPSHPEKSLTLQYFPGIETSAILTLFAPHNLDIRQAEDTSKWPPDILFNISYAAGALQAWGSEEFKEYVRSQTRDIYYPVLKGDMLDVAWASWEQSAREYNQQYIKTAEYAHSRNKVEEWLQLAI